MPSRWISQSLPVQPYAFPEKIKDQIKKAGKNPHFGAEKSLFKIQERILEMTGPLTCLWSDTLNQKATVKQEDILLLLQRVLVLLRRRGQLSA